MESDQFDQVARRLASGIARRGVLRLLPGMAVLVGSGSLALREAPGAARTRRRRQRQVQAQKGPCKTPSVRCGKGKTAQCCTCQQDCSAGCCVPKDETVSLRFVDFDGYHTHCTVWVDVTGFPEGTYIANVDSNGGQYEATVNVGADGTGSGAVFDGAAFQTDAGLTVAATMEGVCSGSAVLIAC